MEEIAIIANNIGVKYSRKNGLFKRKSYWALKDVSFSLLRGETLGIIGRNGAGKSTLLRILAGVLQPDQGNLEIRCKSISLLALQLGFNLNLTGRDNIILSGMLMGMRYKEIRNRIDDIIHLSEIYDFIDQPLKTYSTGMRVKLGFAVAIQVDPDVLLIDEVLGVGDEAFRIKSSKILKNRIKSDKTVVLVSHNLSMMENLCNRLLWINAGIGNAIGNPKNILFDYRQNMQRK